MSVRRVLIIGPSNIGDGILISDSIARASQAFPDAQLTLLLGERACVLFEEDPRIHLLVDLDRHSDVASRLKLFLRLWRQAPQVIIDLRHTVYPLLLKPWRFWRYLRRPPKTIVHMHDRHLWHLKVQAPEILRQAPQAPLAAFWLGPKDHAQVQQLLRRWNLSERAACALICPGARSHLKRWPAEGFAAVANRLHKELGLKIVFSGEPDEEPIIDEIRHLMTAPSHSTVGLVTMRQLGLLMRRMSVVVTNDSASLHLASAMDRPVVAVFGPTDERKYGPWGAIGRVVRRRLFCAPCEQAQCRFSHECMRYVEADEVVDAVRQVLAQSAPIIGR